jgi:hypothetical protein
MIEGIYRILMKCLHDNVEELGTDLDSTRIEQSEYSGTFYVMHRTSIDRRIHQKQYSTSLQGLFQRKVMKLKWYTAQSKKPFSCTYSCGSNSLSVWNQIINSM